ncbi:hypothetical protein [Kitasatospora sp. MBT66]|uniref:hypothetical protein n=1 Tax=Kitasatospora sp. MBT66 TaxID=1444769 RepID=UPI0011EA619C|nr:hypothetical protein [Kitasatospora sp. MBT66]
MVGAERETLKELIQELASTLGLDASSWQDGHGRWEIYRRAADHPGVVEKMYRAVEIEPDPSISSAAVVMMLERVDCSTRARWVELIQPQVRKFAEIRARELDIFESLTSPGVTVEQADLEGWSDWLQLRVAKSASDRLVLSRISEHGRTKRIRRIAADRLRADK